MPQRCGTAVGRGCAEGPRCDSLPLVGRGLQLSSGRVIALGRLLLAISFLVAIWVDVTQPAQDPVETFTLLIGYVVFAALIAAVTWNNWWLDAQLAGPAHAVDILLFTVLVLLTEGYTSPFFVFFIFLLLAAAIRWGWRETALTAILVTILYLVAGILAVNSSPRFELYRFIVRTGHLVILSLILIWFGIHQWRARATSRVDELLAEPWLDRSPHETALRAAMEGVGAAVGSFLWIGDNSEPAVTASREGQSKAHRIKKSAAGGLTDNCLLYDLGRRRSLSRDAERSLIARDPNELIKAETINALGLTEGLAVPVRTGTGDGMLFLEQVRGLSTDHLDIGEQIGADVAAHIQRHALLKAAADNAEGRSRLSLARDLHDSVVQFLAGAAFRLEAMKRSEASGRKLEPELNELKSLMLQEQGELRSFITALRSGSQVALADLARDLEGLATRLSRQWDIKCDFAADHAEVMIPTALHLDVHQLVREGVANAVRHAGAKSVAVELAAGAGALQLSLVNDGAAFPHDPQDIPQTLKERVEQAGGTIELSRGMDVTKIAIVLPVDGGSL